MIEVTLTQTERAIADLVARERMEDSIQRTDRLYEKSYEQGLNVHRMGAYGEIAAAKALNVYPLLTVGEFRGMKPDLRWKGALIEVRHRSKHSYDLIIRKGDPLGRVFVLTTGLPPVIQVHGYWAHHDESDLKEEWLKDHGKYGKPSYFIPKTALTQFTL